MSFSITSNTLLPESKSHTHQPASIDHISHIIVKQKANKSFHAHALKTLSPRRSLNPPPSLTHTPLPQILLRHIRPRTPRVFSNHPTDPRRGIGRIFVD